MRKRIRGRTIHSAKQEVNQYVKTNKFAKLEGISAYQLAFLDRDFMLREELRPVRLQLELLKPELIQKEHGINSTVVVFGSARIHPEPVMKKIVAELEEAVHLDPQNTLLARKLTGARGLLKKSKFYEEARALGKLFSQHETTDELEFVVSTGGGPGIMEAANRGAYDVQAKSIGLGIVIPTEDYPNEYVTPELLFQFHYFALRKMHFLMRARALIAFPGGYGTLDELFEALTLMQQNKITQLPLILMGREYWEKLINFEAMVDEGVIAPQDLNLFQYAETAQEAYDAVMVFYEAEK